MDDISIYNHAREIQQGMVNEAKWQQSVTQQRGLSSSQPLLRWQLRDRLANLLIRWGTYLKQADSLTAVSPSTIAHSTQQ